MRTSRPAHVVPLIYSSSPWRGSADAYVLRSCCARSCTQRASIERRAGSLCALPPHCFCAITVPPLPFTCFQNGEDSSSTRIGDSCSHSQQRSVAATKQLVFFSSAAAQQHGRSHDRGEQRLWFLGRHSCCRVIEERRSELRGRQQQQHERAVCFCAGARALTFLFHASQTCLPLIHDRRCRARKRPRACPASSWCWSATVARVRGAVKRKRGRGT